MGKYTQQFIYLFIYLFIYYEWSYNTYIVQEESANKVTKKLRQSKMRNQVSHRTVVLKHATIRTRSSADADNRLDAFSGQSRSTNMVPFHMLHIVSYCAIVTTVFLRYSSSKNFMTLKWGSKVIEKGHSKVTQGHWEWYHSIGCVWFPISVL